MRRARVGVTLALALGLAPGAAQAHQGSVSYLNIDARGRSVVAVVRIEALDLNEALGAPPGLELTRAQAMSLAARGAGYVRARLTISNADRRCVPGVEHRAEVVDRERTWDLALTLTYSCANEVDALGIRYDLFFDVDPRHQGMTTASVWGRASRHVFVARDRQRTVSGGRTLRHQLLQYLELGVEHIFTGYDHVAFLCALLLVAGARPLREAGRYVLAVVTSFTLAHSLTLVGAALGWLALSPRVVEPAIALSIGYVAVENLVIAEPRRRYALTFAFGLVHGFGFASVLAEQGLPARAAVASLLCFNVGVELGNVAVVLLALPAFTLAAQPRWTARRVAVAVTALAALWALMARAGVAKAPLTATLAVALPALALAGRRWGHTDGVRRPGSVALALLALLWFVERVTGRSLLGGALG